MKPLVIYHANCWDGFCAAWIADRALCGAECLPFHYGQEPPNVKDRKVYILDFSFKREVLLKMFDDAYDFVVLDHHKTAKEDLEGLGFCTFDLQKSGARLTWDFFGAEDENIPWLVLYTEDRDLWRHSLPKSKEINAALRSHPLNFKLWDKLAEIPMEDLLIGFANEGSAILRREKQIVDDHIRNAKEIEMDGHSILAVNATVLFSEIAGKLAEGKPFGACYFDRGDGKRQWSLRSTNEGIDVSEIAKQHGGGGHRNAAGFEE